MREIWKGVVSALASVIGKRMKPTPVIITRAERFERVYGKARQEECSSRYYWLKHTDDRWN